MYRLLRVAFTLFLCTLRLSVAWSQATANLSQQGWYADPEIRVFAGEYWIYPTSSDPNTKAQGPASFNPLQKKLREGHVVHPVYLLHTSWMLFRRATWCTGRSIRMCWM